MICCTCCTRSLISSGSAAREVTADDPDAVICTSDYSQEFPYTMGSVTLDVRNDRSVTLPLASSFSTVEFLSFVRYYALKFWKLSPTKQSVKLLIETRTLSVYRQTNDDDDNGVMIDKLCRQFRAVSRRPAGRLQPTANSAAVGWSGGISLIHGPAATARLPSDWRQRVARTTKWPREILLRHCRHRRHRGVKLLHILSLLWVHPRFP